MDLTPGDHLNTSCVEYITMLQTITPPSPHQPRTLILSLSIKGVFSVRFFPDNAKYTHSRKENQY